MVAVRRKHLRCVLERGGFQLQVLMHISRINASYIRNVNISMHHVDIIGSPKSKFTFKTEMGMAVVSEICQTFRLSWVWDRSRQWRSASPKNQTSHRSWHSYIYEHEINFSENNESWPRADKLQGRLILKYWRWSMTVGRINGWHGWALCAFKYSPLTYLFEASWYGKPDHVLASEGDKDCARGAYCRPDDKYDCARLVCNGTEEAQ